MENGIFFKSFFKGLDLHNHIIAFVGGGGKTSLIFKIKDELVAHKKRVIITTTTKMAYDNKLPIISGEYGENFFDNLKEVINNYGYAVVGKVDPDFNKISYIGNDIYFKLKDFCDYLLVEADGAKRLPIKIPRCYEPVIPSNIQEVVAVVGLDGVNSKIKDVTHTKKEVCSFLCKKETDLITYDDIKKIVISPRGLRKNVNNLDYKVYLNKVDTIDNIGDLHKLVKDLCDYEIHSYFGVLK